MIIRRHEFASDNVAPICPEAWTALQEANTHPAASYGEDEWTARLKERVRELFETDCDAYLTFTGTAANALALAQVCPRFHSIICHRHSHIQTDECGASEFYTAGSKLLLAGGPNGKLALDEVTSLVARQTEFHSQPPGVISLSQTTELGTIYEPSEIAAIAEIARVHGLVVHMDGARFANAVAALGCHPRAITWQAGVEALCFGATKNGTAAGELVVFFNKALSTGFEYRLKQAGQLASKTRFLAAPWLGLLEHDAWLRNARRANDAARRLASRLKAEAGLESLFPVQANAVFVPMEQRLAAGLRARGWEFYKFLEPDVYRLMCSWATTEREVADLIADIVAIK